MAERHKESRVLKSGAHCAVCPWSTFSVSALGSAARHHDATGHRVVTEVTRQVIYGKPIDPKALGQLSIDDDDPALNQKGQP